MCCVWEMSPKRAPRLRTPMWTISPTGPSALPPDSRRPAKRWPAPICTNQSVCPGALKARRVGTIYGVILHVTVVLLLLASIVLALVALGRKIAADARWRREKREAKHAGMLIPERPVVLGFAHGFGNALLTLTLTTACHIAHLLRRTRAGDHGRGQTCMGWRTYRDAGCHVLELAGHPSGVRAGAMGIGPASLCT